LRVQPAEKVSFSSSVQQQDLDLDGRHATESTIRYRRERIFFIEGRRQAVGFEIPLNPLTAHLLLGFLSGDFRLSTDWHQPLLKPVKPFIYGGVAHFSVLCDTQRDSCGPN
jgi:hypothetical protein